MIKKPSFVKGFALQNYLSAEDGIFNAAENNYQYWYIDGSLASDMASNWTLERINNLITVIKKLNVLPILHGNFKVPLASDVTELRNAAIEYTKKEINLAQQLSAPLIVHGGAIVEPRLVLKAKRTAINNYIDSVNNLLSYAKSKNVTILLENLSNYQYYKPFHYIFTHEEEIDIMVEAIPDIKLFIDLGHANIGGNNPLKLIEKYFRHIIGMSFSNNNGEQDQHYALDKGIINYHEVISRIVELGWQGIVAFETREKDSYKAINDVNNIYDSLFCSKIA